MLNYPAPPFGSFADKAHSLTRELRAWFQFGESGNLFIDSIRNEPLTTVEAGNGIIPIPTPYGMGLSFDGGNRINLPVSAWMRPSLPVSLAARVKLNNFTNPHGLIALAHSTSTYSGVALQLDANQNIRAQFGDNTGNQSTDRRSGFGGTVPSNQWVTVSASIRGAADMSLYLDGVPVSASFDGTGGAMAMPSNPTCLGGAMGVAFSLNGTLDWAAVWARTLSADEHLALHVDPFQVFRKPALLPTTVPPDDAELVRVSITPNSVQEFAAIDAATIPIDIQVSAYEERQYYDSAEIYINITNTGGECYSAAHLQTEGEATARWSNGSDVTRWTGEEEARWYATAIASGEGC